MMRIMICTDGSKPAEQAAVLISRLNFPPETELILLGVSESDRDQVHLTTAFERIEGMFGGPQPNIQHKIRCGHPSDQIQKEAEANHYDLIALGEKGHPHGLISLRLGSTVNKLAHLLTTPFIVARNVPERLNKILICTGGEAQSIETMRIGGQLIADIKAEAVLLHVMSQVAMRLDSPSEDLLDTAESAIERGTREGKHLVKAMNILRQAGVGGPIVPKIRHGLVIDEVSAEIQEGQYDLLIIGSHYQHRKSHWIEILLEDVAGQLLHNVPCSVLIA